MKLKSFLLAALPLAAVVLMAAAESKSDYRASIMKWRETRKANLTKEDGWLTLVALDWLHSGANVLGSGEKAALKLPKNAPADAGTLTLSGSTVSLHPAHGVAMTIDGKPAADGTVLLGDSDKGGPTTVHLGSMLFYVIRRGERVGIRVKDPKSEARTHFKGLDYYPVDSNWRVTAKLERYDPPKKVTIPNVLGEATQETSPGLLVFKVAGKTYKVEPILEEGETDYFIIFRDTTSGKTTYGAGRFVYAPPVGPDGTTVIDFNKAYNPPCSFTPFATCPLPPPQNRLPFAVTAGEKKYRGGHA